MIEIKVPLRNKDIEGLRAGDNLLITGDIYTARDAVHKRLMDLIAGGGRLPFELKGQVIYYTGPTPARPGTVIGSCGPTTSSRMDPYTPQLLERGLKGMIGKGNRGREVEEAIKKHGAVYFIATGGAGALLAQSINKAVPIAFPELGAEAVLRLEVQGFPVTVAIDSRGNNIYKGPYRDNGRGQDQRSFLFDT